ncbi:hypothetical protein ACVIHI_009123 [Bradyrhizobium sp. USDA 4524]|uniref:hypothetical protein n=1 Tax=unclassified Bradyrhizobium TaxID=2631580 RepID=UPI00209FE576|nr:MULTISPECIES: hypothetical protein [unclassified Bradyrhizobium]MCP1846098.1 hypothetical protein [Bradyrhizobium sp. USDA 4538]MCP1907268.1 hypothetical protein [Bradyrhizobium sp. USDA 4537]MCP1985743.1 hypothetical protein [Bradyrhizobium sp. USDA 4539]
MAPAGIDSKPLSQCGQRFDDILFRGACGGADAVATYLRTRRQMLVRDMSRVAAYGGDPSDHMRAVAVFDCAIETVKHLLALGEVDGETTVAAAATSSGEAVS